MPSITRTAPPVNSALDLHFAPNILPVFTPSVDIVNVVMPVISIAIKIFILKKAKVIPIANASMLVAHAKTNIFAKAKEYPLGFSSSYSFDTLSFIIFPPINPSKTNASQWSKN